MCVSKLVLYFDFGDFDAQKLEYFKNFGPYVLFFPAALSRKCLISLVFLRISSRWLIALDPPLQYFRAKLSYVAFRCTNLGKCLQSLTSEATWKILFDTEADLSCSST